MSELDVSTIETVLLSVPEKQRNMDVIKPVWQTLESLVAEEKVFSLGTCDLDKNQLEELYSLAKVLHRTRVHEYIHGTTMVMSDCTIVISGHCGSTTTTFISYNSTI